MNWTISLLVNQLSANNIAELYPFAYGPFYHFLGKFYFGHVIFLLPLPESLAVVNSRMPTLTFRGAHAVVAILSLFAFEGEVKENLGNPVGDRHAKTFETEDCLMCQMGMDPADPLYGAPGLLVVGIVENQAYVLGLVVGTDTDDGPKLGRYMPQRFPPVYMRIFHKAVEYVLACLDKCFKNPVLVATPCILDSKAREKHQTLEYGQQRVDAVTLALHRKRGFFGHPDLRKYRADSMHGRRHIGILKKVLISERNGVTLCIDMDMNFFVLLP